MDYRTVHNLVIVTVMTATLLLASVFVAETFMVGAQAETDDVEYDDETTFNLVLNSQDDEIGTRICKVEMNTVVSLPYIASDSTSSDFVGWCPYSDGHGVIFPPNAKVLIDEKTFVLYGIWSVPDSE